MGAKFSDNTIIALILTMVGMSVYAGSDLNYNPWGYFWLMVNSAATGKRVASCEFEVRFVRSTARVQYLT
jgi:hypothetical protein